MYSMVRSGIIPGSSSSVIQESQKQIKAGGSANVTHRD